MRRIRGTVCTLLVIVLSFIGATVLEISRYMFTHNLNNLTILLIGITVIIIVAIACCIIVGYLYQGDSGK
jgi:hypothetical protein